MNQKSSNEAPKEEEQSMGWAEVWAKDFPTTYERLAPQFNYETRVVAQFWEHWQLQKPFRSGNHPWARWENQNSA